jgi:histidyl-tRNA synthetase
MVASVDALNAELAQQTELFNKLRIDNSDPAALEESRKRLGELKRELASIKPGGKDSKKKERLLLKTPKVRRPFLSSHRLCADHFRTRRARVIMAPEKCSAASMPSVS